MISKRLIELLLCFCLVAVTTARAQVQKVSVSVLGARDVPSALVQKALEQIGTPRQQSAYRVSAQHAVRDVYARQGYFDADIDSIQVMAGKDSSDVSVLVSISEGCRYLVSKVSITGLRAVDTQNVLDALETKPDSALNPQTIGNDALRILSFTERMGHPFASVRVANIMPVPMDGAIYCAVEFAADEGDEVYIGEVAVHGNDLTSSDVIIRELRLDRNEMWTPELTDRLRKRLDRLNFFASIDEPALYRRDTLYGLLVRVREGNTNSFDGIIGYQPGSNGEKGTVTGLVNLSFRNLFGTGRRVDARWERSSSTLSELEFHYLEPWLAGLPVNVSAGFLQRVVDSSYVRRNVDIKATLLASEAIQLSITGQAIRLIPATTYSANPLASSSTYNAGLELYIDTRDNIYNPASGVTFRNSYTGGYKNISATSTLPASKEFMQRIEIDAFACKRVTGGFVMALALHGRELDGSRIDAGDLYHLGGALTLRGYREEQFSGNRSVWSNLEARYSLGKKSYAFLFYDAGYILLSRDDSQQREEMKLFRQGYGIGARIETPIGVLAVSYALGTGDTFTTAKIHFGLVNDF
jgi:outer membrane protein insertion porin family